MDKLKLNIVELIDEGHTLESSTELQALIGESEELKKFYADLLRSEAKLEDFMNQEGVAEVQARSKGLH
jgi:tRNA isopentenyl-2-thiomethyl-A-37 hydroxylase MiaE